jgi:Nitroreductase family
MRMSRSLTNDNLLALHVPRREGDYLVFETFTDTVTIEDDVDAVLEIVGRANGRQAAGEWIGSLTTVSFERGLEIIAELLRIGVLQRREELPFVMHHLSSNSQPFGFRAIDDEEMSLIYETPRYTDPRRQLNTTHASDRVEYPSALRTLLWSRESSAPIVGNGSPSPDLLREMLFAMYGGRPDGRKVVPSGGALWPLTLYVAGPLQVRTDDLPRVKKTKDINVHPGRDQRWRLWWFDDTQGDLVAIDNDGKCQVGSWFVPDGDVQDALLNSCASVIVIAGDFRRVAAKYGPRGYNNTLMECGAAMQNAYLFAAERELSVRAYAGFFDNTVAAEIGLPDTVVPLLLLLVGQRSRTAY